MNQDQQQPTIAESRHQGEGVWLQVLELNGQRRFAEALEMMNPFFADGNPGPTGWKLRGQSLYGLGRFAEAAQVFAIALARAETDCENYEHLATALLALNCFDQALLTVDRGLQQDANHKGLLRLRFVLLWRVGKTDEALSLAGRHVQKFPMDGPMWHERGVYFLEQGADGEALADLDTACSLMPDNPRWLNNRATALWRLGRFADALTTINRSVALDPNNAGAQHHRALLLLFLGYFSSGFAAYEWRWRDPAHPTRQPPWASPLWRGDNVQDATLLVYPEQGYGDAIHFIRFLPKVKPHVARVILFCSGPLVPLLRHAPGVDLLWEGGSPSPQWHVHAPLMSLPGLLKLDREELFGGMGYLPEFAWEKLAKNRPLSASLRVGLVWRGRPTHRNDHNRSLTLAWFEPLLDLIPLTWVSLQEGGGKEVSENPYWLGRIDCPDFADFAVTARVVQTLDLVITVDTAVAHLAGAMGCPVWVLLPFVPDWRWGPEGENTLWYSSMRLFRQQRLCDWEEVRNRLSSELQAWALTTQSCL
ncbi:MAG: TPR repeat-containing protein [Magnetococcales bacterium]|nr:TPR repeat-containing protein [Magnetococcales bacterium]HIJ85107.1 tetratricopeptide repeat protein [Magnetococcales bacterium]